MVSTPAKAAAEQQEGQELSNQRRRDSGVDTDRDGEESLTPQGSTAANPDDNNPDSDPFASTTTDTDDDNHDSNSIAFNTANPDVHDDDPVSDTFASLSNTYGMNPDDYKPSPKFRGSPAPDSEPFASFTYGMNPNDYERMRSRTQQHLKMMIKIEKKPDQSVCGIKGLFQVIDVHEERTRGTGLRIDDRMRAWGSKRENHGHDTQKVEDRAYGLMRRFCAARKQGLWALGKRLHRAGIQLHNLRMNKDRFRPQLEAWRAE